MRQSITPSSPENGGGRYGASFTQRELAALATNARTAEDIAEGVKKSVDSARLICVNKICAVTGALVYAHDNPIPSGVEVWCAVAECNRKALTAAIGMTESSVDRLATE